MNAHCFSEVDDIKSVYQTDAPEQKTATSSCNMLSNRGTHCYSTLKMLKALQVKFLLEAKLIEESLIKSYLTQKYYSSYILLEAGRVC